MDANVNRAKEGLRVCEDICRFIYDDPASTKAYKKIRHQLTGIMSSFAHLNYIKARDIEGDVGSRGITASELKRRDLKDIFFANSQRVKESIRVLEELAKLFNLSAAKKLKNLRYKVYAVERSVKIGGHGNCC